MPNNVHHRKTRKECLYTDEERAIMAKYKEAYKATINHNERESLLRNHIFPDIFNFWYKEEQDMPDGPEIERKRKDLCQWIRNNWRPTKTLQAAAKARKKSRIDIVWRDRKEEVLEEIKEMGGNSQKDTFQLRTTAAARVFHRLDENDKREVEKAVEVGSKYINPPDIQQRQASKYAVRNVEKWAHEQWNDIGMLTMTFYAYRRDDKKMYVEVHDKMATYSNIAQKSFIDTYPELIESIQVKLLEYVKSLQGVRATSTPLPTAQSMPAYPRSKACHQYEVEFTDGWPKMLLVTESDKLKKGPLEDLIRRYLTAQYKLASGNTRLHIPFRKLCQAQRKFIEPKYCPKGFVFKDPRNMTKGDLLEFCKHVWEQQENHGINNAFCFLKYHDGKGMVPAAYGTRVDEEQAAAKAHKRQEARASAKNRARKNRREMPDEERSEICSQHQASADIHASATNQNTRPESSHSQPTVIDPDLLRNTDTPDAQTKAYANTNMIMVEDAEMQILRNHGYGPVIPINGPNDGLPIYPLPAAAQTILEAYRDNYGTTNVQTRDNMEQAIDVPEEHVDVQPRRTLRPRVHTGKNDTRKTARNSGTSRTYMANEGKKAKKGTTEGRRTTRGMKAIQPH